MDYTAITYDDLYQKFLTLLASDDRFKNIGSASMFGMITEMLCATTDMELYTLQRILEECFFSTAVLDSTYIKLCKNMAYQPRRSVPAQTTLKIVLKGPFPREILNLLKDEKHQNPTITIENEFTKLNFLGDDYLLEDKFSYQLTDDDIRDCVSSTWKKTFRSGMPRTMDKTNGNKSVYRKLYKLDPSTLNITDGSDNSYVPIKCYQATEKFIVFKGEDFYSHFTANENQYYDINDTSFSNWYGQRDPFAYSTETDKTKENYNKKVYAPANGITQVIIALDENEALCPTQLYNYHKKKIFDIEDHSIFLNKKILDANGIPPEKPHDICLLSTNEDKTVRIEFSALDNLTTNGVDFVDVGGGKMQLENIYVKYLSTTGAFANKINTYDSIMNHTNKFFISINGQAYDITNNIEFVITGDIIGGQNFEDNASMKDNANAYFASMMKLVSKRDFIKYFSSLKTPINVNTALVFGENDLFNQADLLEYYRYTDLTKYRDMMKKQMDESNLDTNNSSSNLTSYIKRIAQNNIFYSLINDLYKEKTFKRETDYYPIYLFEEYKNHQEFLYDKTVTVDDNNNPATLYGNNYYNHLTDFIQYLMEPETVYNSEQLSVPNNESSTEEKNIYEVTSAIKNMIIPNTVLYSLPPFLHYFDIVGTIKVKALTKNLAEYHKEMKNTIYEYLKNNMNKSREIYKSDIVNLYYQNENTAYVDIDIKTSTMLTPDANSFEWDYKASNTFPYEYTSETNLKYTYIPNQGVRCIFNNSLNSQINSALLDNTLYINEIIIPYHDKFYNKLDKYNNCNKKLANITLKFKNNKPITKQVICNTTSTDQFIRISLINPEVNHDQDLDYSKYILSLDAPNFTSKLYTDMQTHTGLKTFDITKNDVNDNTVIVKVLNTVQKNPVTSKYEKTTKNYYIDVKEELELYAENNNIQMINLEVDLFEITFLSDDDFWSTSKLSNTLTTKTDELIKDYGFKQENLPDGKTLENIKEELINMVNNWINSMDVHNTADRAIDLPYSVTSYKSITRLEEIARKGDIIKTDQSTLSEHSFWTYFMPLLLNTFYGSDSIYYDATCDATWGDKVKLILDIYKLVKPGLNDSVLDDNNNIVNFSSDLEVAVVRNMTNVIYETTAT